MKYFYGEFDGEPFPTQDKLFGFDQLMEFLLEYGDKALRAMQQAMKDPNNPTSDLLEQLLKDGMLDKDGKGKLKLTPRAVSRMQMKALSEIFKNLRSGNRDGHEKTTAGAGGERLEGTKPYQFGDPISDVDLNATLRNAMQRTARASSSSSHDGVAGSANPTNPTRPPLRFRNEDIEVHPREGTTSVSTVVLIDLSGSMGRYERYISAKKVALGLLALVRQRFPQDTVDFVGFYSGASKIPEVALPLIMPKRSRSTTTKCG